MKDVESMDSELSSLSNKVEEKQGDGIEKKNNEETTQKENNFKDNSTEINAYIKDDKEIEQTFLNKNDFINPTYRDKKNFCETRYFKRIILIIIYIFTYSFNAIFIRINSLDLVPIKACFIQGAIFSIFIPISFFFSSNKYFKKKRKNLGKEKEVLNIDIENNMKENLSDYMNKRYYEVYYQYLTKFYFLTGFCSVLYCISIFLFYKGISYTQPLFGQIFFSFISFILMIAKLVDKNIKYDCTKIMSIICILGSSIFYMISFVKNDINEFDKNHIISTIYLIFFVICQCLIIYFMKKVFKKYFYYVEVFEFVGYMGIYIMAVVPFILVIIYFTFDRGLINNNPSGNSLFYVIGKAFFSTCICDLCLVYILKYFSLKITCKIMIINLSLIYLIFYLVTGKVILNNYYFLLGQLLSVILIFLLFKNVYEKNLKREVFEMTKIKLRASII